MAGNGSARRAARFLAKLLAQSPGGGPRPPADPGRGDRPERVLQSAGQSLGVRQLADQARLEGPDEPEAEQQRLEGVLVDEGGVCPPTGHEAQRGVDLRQMAMSFERLRELDRAGR